MILKEIGRKIAQAFRLARAADEKVASSIAAALDAKAEQIKEYEKRFEPEPPEPDLPQEINAASPFTFEFYLAGIPIAQAMAAAARCSSDEMASAILKVIAQKPEPLSHQTNNWRKMHGLLMPMKKNIPKGHPEWSLVKCPICGQECWRPISRQELRQKKMQAACTECGLKIESRRNQP